MRLDAVMESCNELSGMLQSFGNASTEYSFMYLDEQVLVDDLMHLAKQ